MSKKTIPMLDFDTTLKFVIQLNDKYQDRVMSPEDITNILELKSASTGSYSYRVSYAKALGLLDNSGTGMIQISQLAKKIIYPETDDLKKINDLKKYAFMNSNFNKELLNRFEKSELPTQSTLSNILLNDFGVKVNSKNKVAKCFLDSLSQLGIDKSRGHLFIDQESKISSKEDTESMDLFSDIDDFANEITQENTKNNEIDVSNDDNKPELLSLDYDLNFSIKNTQTNIIVQIPRNMLSNKKQLELTKKMIDAQMDILMG